MPSFKSTIPVAQMARGSSNGLSAEDKAVRAQYDKWVTDGKSDQASVLTLNTELGADGKPYDNARAVQMRLRAAAKRTGKTIDKMVNTGTEIQFTVVNGAKAPAQAALITR